jgi:hypothetical protein
VSTSSQRSACGFLPASPPLASFKAVLPPRQSSGGCRLQRECLPPPSDWCWGQRQRLVGSAGQQGAAHRPPIWASILRFLDPQLPTSPTHYPPTHQPTHPPAAVAGTLWLTCA